MLLALAWLFVSARLLWDDWGTLAATTPDADDAMRLVQWRAWRANPHGLLGGWFDLHEARLAPPLGYDTHWSRLIDAGLAGLFGIFRLFADADLAERLTRATWPLLWLLPTMAGTASIAWRLAGPSAAQAALLIMALATPAYVQFAPGRIDHHNVQIALAVLVLAATVWSDRVRWAAWAAGALTGAALATGLEGLPYLAACGAALALRHVVTGRDPHVLAGYGLALAGSTALALLVNVPPAHWGQPACDAIAINLAAAVAAGGLGLALVARIDVQHAVGRAGLVVAAGAVTAAIFASFEPRCLRGPYGLVDPAIWPIWLGEVREMRPLLRLAGSLPLTAAAFAAFPLVGLAAALVLARAPALRRDFAFLTAVGIAALSTLVMAGMIKGFFYAVWFAAPLMAVAAVRIAAWLRMRNLVARIVVTLAFTPNVVAGAAIAAADAAGLADSGSFASPEAQACSQFESYAGLRRLPRGLVVAPVTYGPYILATTEHSVLAGPYHRLGSAIVDAHQALAAEPAAARATLARVGADYLLLCRKSTFGLRGTEPASLEDALQAGGVPDWLERVSEPGDRPILIYRLRR